MGQKDVVNNKLNIQCRKHLPIKDVNKKESRQTEDFSNIKNRDKAVTVWEDIQRKTAFYEEA